MKKALLLSIVAVVLAAVAVEWGMSRVNFAGVRTSSSQIYIHGTPVCILKDGEAIVARVGPCGPVEEPGEGMSEEPSFHGRPGVTLPPGHPPIPPDMAPDVESDGAHRVAI